MVLQSSLSIGGHWKKYREKKRKRSIQCPEKAVDELSKTLGRAVEEQMVADVPLGAFLSGGLDSSLVVALMCERSSRKVNTFTIGFNDNQYDEAIYARDIASFLKQNIQNIFLNQMTHLTSYLNYH